MRVVLLVLVCLATTAYAQPLPPDPTDGSSDPQPAPAPAPSPDPVTVVEPQPAPPSPSPSPRPVEPVERPAVAVPSIGYSDGFYLQSPDGANKLQVGGYTQYDARWFPDDRDDPHVSQFAFRVVRPELKGTLFQHYDFRVLTDFGGGKVQLQDAYVDVHYCDEIELRLGKTKVPFGLERLQRDIYTTFVERGLPSLLTPNRTPGAELFGLIDKGLLEYELGVFDVTADNGSNDGDINDHKQYVARVFARPLAHGGPLVTNLGVGAAITYSDERGTAATPDVASLTTQAGTTFFAYKTGTTAMDTVVASGTHWRATAQGYYYAGPLGVLAEYVKSRQDVAINGSKATSDLDAWQALAQYVITGEKATYNSVTPAHKYGAFDVAARYGEVRLADSQLYGSFADPTKSAHRIRSVGVGVDWFANKGIRFVLDVERSWYWLGGPNGDRPSETSVVARVQAVF